MYPLVWGLVPKRHFRQGDHVKLVGLLPKFGHAGFERRASGRRADAAIQAAKQRPTRWIDASKHIAALDGQ